MERLASGSAGVQEPPAAPALEAHDLTIVSDERTLLSNVSLSIRPGELVALIGPSGAGKTTLLRALTGQSRVNGGTVRLGENLRERRNGGIGYVPSDDLLHDQLTVTEELFYAAALRGPADQSGEAIEALVAMTLEDLHLTDLAHQRVKLLSKGERRRTSVAVELVGAPDVLLLDEPGSGLDAGLERRLMKLLRGLADQGRAVLAATHATASLRMCDRVAVLGRGGTMVGVGTVDEVLAHFGVDSIEAVYERLDEMPRANAPARGAGESRPADTTVSRAPAPWFGRQLAITTERAAICRVRDTRSLAILIAQAPIIGVVVGLVLPHGSLSDQNLGPYYGVLMSFILVTASVWLGTITACRDIVGEIGIVRREIAVGLRLDVYLVSRVLTLMPVVLIQTGLLGVFVVVLQSPPHGAGWIILGCMFTGVSAACFGLWLSAWARNTDIAIASTPLIMIPQMMLAGALIPLGSMPKPFEWLADLLVGRWSFDCLGSGLGLGQSIGNSLTGVTGLASTSFAAQPITPALVLLGLGLVALLLAGGSLVRRFAA